jgi:DHA3 family macrolide efflux protein-like MFS transporter
MTVAEDISQERPGWQKPFFTIWTGQLFSLLGSALVQFALVWWITDTTRSATVLATATLVAMLPQILLGPFAGALVDRWDRRRTMIAADSLVALASLLLAVLFLTDRAQVWHVYAAMLIRSLGGAFHWPAMQASTSLMVPDKQLARIAGLNQALFGIINIASPPLGALLIGLLPIGGVLLIDVFTAAAAVISLFVVSIPQPARAAQPDMGGGLIRAILRDMGAGLRYASGWPGLLALGAVATLINFLVNPAFSLVPILVTGHFGGAAMQLGLLNSTWGIGLVAGGLILSAWGGFHKRIYTSCAGLAGMGAGILLIGAAPAEMFWLGVVGMGVAGLMNPIANGPLFAIFQASVAPEMQGRVFSLIGSVAGAISPLSLAIAGPVADRLGVQVWYLVAGAACILMAVACLLIPAIQQIEEQGKALRAAG